MTNNSSQRTSATIDDVVTQILQESICQNRDILPHLTASKAISDQRGGYYGFEWILHTAVAKYVIDNQERLSLTDIRVNRKDVTSQKIPDLAFAHTGTPTYLEFKTISGNAFSYCKSDFTKLSHMLGNRFIVICGYRNGIERLPDWEGVVVLDPMNIDQAFRLVIMKLC